MTGGGTNDSGSKLHTEFDRADPPNTAVPSSPPLYAMNSTEIDNAAPPNAAVIGSLPTDAPEKGSGSSAPKSDDASANCIGGSGRRHGNMPFHPLANVFPLMIGQDFADLVQSIKDNGLNEPITEIEGMILDGRNRYLACLEAGVEPIIKPFDGDDPIKFVIAKNVTRRHLDVGQRAMIAGKFASLPRGRHIRGRSDDDADGPNGPSPPTILSNKQAAALMRVGVTSVKAAPVVLAEGTEQEKAAVWDKASVRQVAAVVQSRRPPSPRAKKTVRLAQRGNNPERRPRQAWAIWNDLKSALISLGHMPRPEDMAQIARKFDRSGVVDERLKRTLQWLKEFEDAWESSGN